MGLKAKAKSSSERWGMGFLLVFFPEEEAIIDKKANLLSSSSSSSSSPSSSSSSPSFSSCFRPVTTVRRSSSSLLFTRAQSTISICALLIFITLLLFTLSTFEPTATTTGRFASRRHLSSSNPPLYIAKTSFPRSPSFPLCLFTHNSHSEPIASPTSSYALQGMGTLYRRGTRAMNDLIVAHVTESDSLHELPLFLRALQRSALLSRSDLVFLFPSRAPLSDLDVLIKEENESFLKVICRHQVNRIDSEASFDVTQVTKSSKKRAETRETVWGRRIRSNYSEEGQSESTRLSYGSVVAFQADELDPENSLAGFLDNVPMSLRRWACYPMLLGRVRREFKHIMLVEVKETLAHGDPLSRVRNRSPGSVHLSTVSESTNATPNKHGKKNSVKTQPHNHKLVNPATIVGGVRGVRRLSNAMLMEIVRATTQHERKNSVSESGLLSQLVGNGLILKSVNLITSTESITDANRSLG